MPTTSPESEQQVTPKAHAKPVKVGFVGAGNVLWAYLQQLDRLVPRGFAVEGRICARRAETWAAILARRPGTQLVMTPLEVVESDVDVVVVITAPNSFVEISRLALEHDKHVVVEKPFAGSRAEGEAIGGLAADRGLMLLIAPFVQLSPTFRVLWGQIRDGAIGHVHSARGLYGNAGPHWARFYHESGIGPFADCGIYNLKSLTALLGPVSDVLAAEATVIVPRFAAGVEIVDPDPDVSHVVLRHASGALSSIISSMAIQRYRRPALELYGTDGTANLLGDDWDPRGFDVWRNEVGRWEEYEPVESTWLWADGLREVVMALRDGRPPLTDPLHDLHLIDVIEAVRRAVKERATVPVASRFGPLDLMPEALAVRHDRHHLHDHTRPSDEQ